MAQKNVSFSITAKDEASKKINNLSGKINEFSKGVKNSLKPLDNFGKSLKSLGSMGVGLATIAGGFTAVVKGIQSAVSAMKEWESAWAEADSVIRRIDFAGTINKQLNMSSKELMDFSSDLSAKLKGAFSVDEINASIAKIAWDKTGDEIKNITSLATDLSAALGISLDEAVTQLNNSFSGSVGTLGKYFPELKNITAEGLKSGDALLYLKDAVGGVADSMKDSAEYSMRTYQNSVDNLKEALGSLVTDFLTPVRDELAGLMADFTNDLNKIQKMIADKKRIASGGGTKEEVQQQIDLWKAEFDRNESIIRQREQNYKSGKTSNLQSDYFYQQALADKASAGQNLLKYQDMMEAIIREEQNYKEVKADDFKTKNPEIHWKDGTASTTPSAPVVVEPSTDWDAYFSDMLQEINSEVALMEQQEEREEYLNSLTDDWDSYYEDMLQEINADVAAMEQLEKREEYLADLEEEQGENWDQYYTDLMAEINDEVETQKSIDKRAEYLKDIANNTSKLWGDFLSSNLGDISTVIRAFKEDGGGWTAILISLTQRIIDQVDSASTLFNYLLNFFDVVVMGVINPIAEIVETFLPSIFTFIESISDAVGSVLNFVATIIQTFEPEINMIISSLSYIMTFFTALFDTIDYWATAFLNGFVMIYNALNGWEQDKALYQSRKNWNEISKEWENVFNGNSVQAKENNWSGLLGTATPVSNGTGASYTAQRDIIVNINVSNSFINGDAREIALQIEKELQSAHALGY